MSSSALSARRYTTRDLVLFALFTALIAIGAFIRIGPLLSLYIAIIVHYPGRIHLRRPSRCRFRRSLCPLRISRFAGLYLWRRSILYFPAYLRLSPGIHRRRRLNRLFSSPKFPTDIKRPAHGQFRRPDRHLHCRHGLLDDDQ